MSDKEFDEKEIESNRVDFRDCLRLLHKKYRFSIGSLSRLTGAGEQLVVEALRAEPFSKPAGFSGDFDSITERFDDRARVIVMNLALAVDHPLIDPEDRTRAIITGLMDRFDLSLDTFSVYSRIETSEIRKFLNQEPIDPEHRFKLAVNVLSMQHLIFAKE
ncbi:hypothetical protein QWJ34_03335 [Saccharibacillus sp. CPCC 101409]|uniref:HTH domain-containing protein n=1 Tax=Saccharibacillus sp. CPCC 101409 TaxID=3058041 RepID=UPI0026711182|nr:HTH domain-containing protein [Saccharibacillus sp. CPCC 101409]MDO3408791.1 hypothetical protein [Saccharibacillus sp. CPCC 101409]